MMAETKLAKGMNIRRSVLGDAHVDRAEANKSEFDADFQQFITEFAWGTVWAGGEIDRQTRHMLTIAIRQKIASPFSECSRRMRYARTHRNDEGRIFRRR
jgi:hypothetical protein